MPVDERRERARLLRHRICDEDITQWFSKQLKDLYDIVDGSPLSDTRAGVAAVSR
jgi:trehalose-6-phosphate synthase